MKVRPRNPARGTHFAHHLAFLNRIPFLDSRGLHSGQIAAHTGRCQCFVIFDVETVFLYPWAVAVRPAAVAVAEEFHSRLGLTGIVFSLLPLSRYLERGSGKVYEQNEPAANKEKIQSTSIERRYQINLVVAIDQGRYNELFERYKITLDRSGIIELRKADAFAAKEPGQRGRYSKLWALLHLHKQK